MEHRCISDHDLLKERTLEERLKYFELKCHELIEEKMNCMKEYSALKEFTKNQLAEMIDVEHKIAILSMVLRLVVLNDLKLTRDELSGYLIDIANFKSGSKVAALFDNFIRDELKRKLKL